MLLVAFVLLAACFVSTAYLLWLGLPLRFAGLAGGQISRQGLLQSAGDVVFEQVVEGCQL